MWLTCSSIGRKFVMALTGICLVLFVTFHCVMNAVALLWPVAYNAVCQFLGANWYALVASACLGLLFIIHIIYATVLTVQNRKARGTDRYAVNSRPADVEWSSKNMFVLGIVVLAFLVVHLVQFWSKMQLQEICSPNPTTWAQVDGLPADPALGTLFIQMAFSQWWTPVVYVIGFVALWFHLNHGFWSMFHTIGWDNNIWLSRLRKIGRWWSTIVVALFIVQAAMFYIKANSADNNYINDPSLHDQYVESFTERVAPVVEKFIGEYNKSGQECQMLRSDEPMQAMYREKGQEYLDQLKPVVEAAKALHAEMANTELANASQIVGMVESALVDMKTQEPQPEPTPAAAPAPEPEPAAAPAPEVEPGGVNTNETNN